VVQDSCILDEDSKFIHWPDMIQTHYLAKYNNRLVTDWYGVRNK